MPSDAPNQRQEAHAFLDYLSPEQLSAVHKVLESMLSPFQRSLALAPIDDEELTPEEAESIERGMASLARGEGVSMEVVLADFGLTVEDLRETAEKK